MVNAKMHVGPVAIESKVKNTFLHFDGGAVDELNDFVSCGFVRQISEPSPASTRYTQAVLLDSDPFGLNTSMYPSSGNQTSEPEEASDDNSTDSFDSPDGMASQPEEETKSDTPSKTDTSVKRQRWSDIECELPEGDCMKRQEATNSPDNSQSLLSTPTQFVQVNMGDSPFTASDISWVQWGDFMVPAMPAWPSPNAVPYTVLGTDLTMTNDAKTKYRNRRKATSLISLAQKQQTRLAKQTQMAKHLQQHQPSSSKDTKAASSRPSVPAASTPSNFCHTCGDALRPSFKFCQMCGTSVSNA